MAENSIKTVIKPEPISLEESKAVIKHQKALVENLIKYGLEKQKLCEELFKKISKAVENANRDISRGKEPHYPKFYELKERIDRFKNNFKNDEVFDTVYYHVASNFCIHQEMEFGELMVKPERTKNDKDKKDKFSLEQQLEELQTQFAALQAENAELLAFKQKVEEKEKDELIASFYMLSDEDKKDVIDNKANYSLKEIKAELSMICVDKKVNFNLENAASVEEAPVTFNLNSHQADTLPAWLKAVEATRNRNK